MNISMIIPAAGLSTRYPNKLLMNNDFIPDSERYGKTIIETTISKFIDLPIDVVVVVGHHKTKIVDCLNNTFSEKIKIVENTDYKHGMSTSLISGLSELELKTDYFGFCLADKPFIKKSTVKTLYNILVKNTPNILVPTFNDIIGHPIFFKINYKKQYFHLKKDVGGKSIIEKEKKDITFIPIKDSGIVKDMDQYLSINNLQ